MANARRREIEERLRAHARYQAWLSAHPTCLAPAKAMAAAGALYELLPMSSRTPPVDPRGVMTLHDLLRRTCAVK